MARTSAGFTSLFPKRLWVSKERLKKVRWPHPRPCPFPQATAQCQSTWDTKVSSRTPTQAILLSPSFRWGHKSSWGLFVFLVVVFFFLSSSFVKDYMTIEHLSSSFSFPAPSQIQETSLQSCSLLFSLPVSFQKLVWSSLQPALRMKDLEGHTKSLGFQERMVWSWCQWGTMRLGGVVDDLVTEEMLGHKTALWQESQPSFWGAAREGNAMSLGMWSQSYRWANKI